QTFAGYAAAQIRKARGLNKKMNHPQPEMRKPLLAFCHVLVGAGTQPLADWLQSQGWEAAHCGLSRMPHGHDLYALYYDPEADFRGIFTGEEVQEVSLSSIPKGCEPVAHLYVNRDGYKRHGREHREYWDWVAQRNESRYQESQGQGYDTKNMMHTFRLLQMAEEILRTGHIRVERPNREELLAIRAGAIPYEELLARVEALLADVEAAAGQSPLPEAPDEARIEATLVDIRSQWYFSPEGR
ncbi:MAG: nucleotidyltransferase, partial [Bacteroidetes bacterium]